MHEPQEAQPSGRLSKPLRRLLMRMGKKRFAKEWEAYEHPPEVRAGKWFGRESHGKTQVHRSLIQINFYRRS